MNPERSNPRRVALQALGIVGLIVLTWAVWIRNPVSKSGGIQTVVRTGDEVPGEPEVRFDALTGVALNSSGKVAFKATVTGPQITNKNDEGIWMGYPGTLVLIAREGAEAPGTTGQVFGDTMFPREAPVLNDSGQIAFKSSVASGDPSSQGIWFGTAENLEMVALSGSSAPGTEDGARFAGFEDILLNDGGYLVFTASLTGASVTDDIADGIWAGRPGNIELVIRSGPALTPTQHAIVRYDSVAFDGLSLNSEDRLMFRAQFPPAISGNTIYIRHGLFMHPPLLGSWLRVRPGDRARGSYTFRGLGRPTLNDSNNYAFLGWYDATHEDEDSGIWIDRQGTRYVVVVENKQAPGTPEGVRFNRLTGAALNSRDEMAFISTLRGDGITGYNDEGIWAGSRGSLSLVARRGDNAPGAPGATFGRFVDKQINSSGRVAFEADLMGDVGTHEDRGIWSAQYGHLSLVAREGDSYQVAPGLIRTVTDLTPGFVLSDSGQVAFIAQFSDQTAGVMLVSP